MNAFRRFLLAAVVVLSVSSVGQAQDDNLTGTWYGPGGMTVSVRQVGKDVWWLWRSGDGGKAFTALFHGKLDGDTLTGDFADVPEGKNRNNGSLKAKLVAKEGKVVSIDCELMFPGNDKPAPLSIGRTKPEK